MGHVISSEGREGSSKKKAGAGVCARVCVHIGMWTHVDPCGQYELV